MNKLLLPLLLLFLLAGCTMFVRQPQVSLRDLKVTSVDTSGASVDLHLSVSNPNPFDIILDGYSYRVSVLDLPLTEGGARRQTVFSGNSETDLRIPVRVTYKDMLEILKHRPDPGRIPYHLSAGLEIRSPRKLYIPIENSATFALPEALQPEYYLRKFKNLFDGGDSK